MTNRSVRWGRACRGVALTGVGLVALPAVLAGPASAASGGPTVKHKITVLEDTWGDREADDASKDDLTGRYQPEKDPGSLFTVTKAIGARDVWGQRDARGQAVTGRGVGVALLDSGLVPIQGLDAPGKVVQGPDLSLENDTDELIGLDSFGHGTHLGAIIAGRDDVAADRKTGQLKEVKPADTLGVAPDARLLAVKLATANGSTDVSQVIAALDWVSQHAGDGGLNVRVVNLSFGTDSLQPYQVDPLAAAAENAWRHGLVVVVSAGNEGQQAGRLTDPAIDPYVIAVGASDPNLKIDGWKTPTVAEFSNSGTADRHVDVLAPGRSITSLRDPGSYIDAVHPEGRVAGDSTGRLFRGSGTSQAAAVVSGAAALLLQANPALTPDQVKAALTATAVPVPGVSARLQGAGQVDVKAALAAVQGGKRSAAVRSARQSFPVAAGDGSLEGARGGSNLVDATDGSVLAGEVDVQGQPFDASAWSVASADGTAWSAGMWNSARWSGDTWASTGWDSARWSSARWSSARWSSARWSSARWSSARWSSARWSSARWSSARWSSARWSSQAWS